MLKLSCARRRSCQSAFGQGFDSPQLHQNTQVRTLLVQKRVRPDKKTAAEVIVLCGSFLFAGVALCRQGLIGFQRLPAPAAFIPIDRINVACAGTDSEIGIKHHPTMRFTGTKALLQFRYPIRQPHNFGFQSSSSKHCFSL